MTITPQLQSPAELAAAAQWWRVQLEEAPSQVALPRGGAASAAADAARVTLPDQLTGAVDATDGIGSLLAGLLARYTSTGQVVVTVGNRGRWIPVAVDFADDPERVDALARWRQARQAAEKHPIALAELADSENAGAAVTQVALGLDDTVWPLAPAPVLEVRYEAGDLTLATDSVVGSGVAGDVAVHLRALLAGWQDRTRLSQVAILSESELRAVLGAASGADLDVPAGTVWDLVSAVAQQRPDALALVDDDARMTYRELVERVDALAADLMRHGAGPGRLIGVCIQRSINMVIGLLAILRSGAAYVPIDPSYPRDRLAMMVEDAQLTMLVTERSQLDTVPAEGLTCVFVEDEHAPAPAEAFAGEVGPSGNDLAYVIFTSGSTGRPKGVMIGHRALTNFVTAISHEPGLTAADRLLAVTTLSFDIAALELLVPLVVGGCVVVAGRETVVDPAALVARLQGEAITVMQATPATWRMLVDWGWTGTPGLRVLCGGEALPVALAAALQERCAELWNMYGPTETTIWSLATRLRADDPITIGTPIANTSVYVVGPHQELLPDGVAGELLIGGLGLAEGYLGRPEMTASRFIPDTFDPRPGGRLYRTGDLVRRRADGRLDFIGRMDNQVKVRGFRIELGDVETALDTHSEVARSVAVVRPDARSGAHQLVAYAVLKGTASTDGLTLRRHLAALLPAYMVPSAVVVLDAFPLTLNAKIDRKSLPDPDLSVPQSDQVAARTPLERQLVAIWERVLKLSPIGVTDDVFELGASSLTTARLYAEVGRELSITLPIATAFQAPTVEKLAVLIDGQRQGAPDPGSYTALVPIRPAGARLPLFLVHGGAGTVLLFEPLARRLGEQQPVYAFQAVGLYGQDPPQRSVVDMARRYVSEMRMVQPRGPYRIGGYCFGALVAYEMAVQLDAAGERTELLVTFNGPSASYIHHYNPIFDAAGALTDEAGQRTRARRRWLDQLRSAWQESVPAFLHEAAAGGVWRVRKHSRRIRRDLRVQFALAVQRPLPQAVREGDGFQRLAELAQNRYHPGQYAGSMLVVRAAGLYHREDLGWSDHVTGSVSVVDVSGKQVKPRDAMTDAFVAPIVQALQDRLRLLDAP